MATVGARKTFSEHSIPGNPCKLLLVLSLLTYLIFISFRSYYPNSLASALFSTFNKTSPSPQTNSLQPIPPTDLNHLVFGIFGSEKALHHRKPYIESWWRPNTTRGLLYLDKSPTGDLLPWSPASPPYRVSNLTKFKLQTKINYFTSMMRTVHGITEVLSEIEHDDLRWLVIGDDDTVFFVDNIVDVLSRYDHTKYYYIGGHSEYILANYLFSFGIAFGGAGIVMSYPLAKALADGMGNCLLRNGHLPTSDMITGACVAEFGVNLSPLMGMHQIDLHGDISGFLSSHPKSPLMSLHHFDMVEPIFPKMDRYESTRHLMKAAAADQSRLLQQTICHHRQSNWSFSVSWGYSAHIYEKIMSSSYLQKPIETFQQWLPEPKGPPRYMFNTRWPANNSCEAPHVFFFKKVSKDSTGVFTTYSRAAARGRPPCALSGNRRADSITEIRVISPTTRRREMDRCECCDIVGLYGAKAELKFRECMINEIIG